MVTGILRTCGLVDRPTGILRTTNLRTMLVDWGVICRPRLLIFGPTYFSEILQDREKFHVFFLNLTTDMFYNFDIIFTYTGLVDMSATKQYTGPKLPNIGLFGFG